MESDEMQEIIAERDGFKKADAAWIEQTKVLGAALSEALEFCESAGAPEELLDSMARAIAGAIKHNMFRYKKPDVVIAPLKLLHGEEVIRDGVPTELYNMAGEGMSLRDWFAGQALAGMFSATGARVADTDPAWLATCAYNQADAMLAEREKTDGG